MHIESDIKLDFSDILIKPQRSNSPSRKNVILERTFKMLHSKQELKVIPICAANMDTVGSMAMARALVKQNLLCCLHKFYPPDELIKFFKSDYSENTFYTLGLKDVDWEKLQVVSKQVYIKMICLDAANANTCFFVDKVKRLREKYPNAIMLVGNICTSEMVQELLLAGADICKIGVGSGAVCTTRLMTGIGYPQFSAICECANAAHGLNGFIMGDGGCKTPGDIAKALGGGADFVMLGSMLAGTDECEGEWTERGLKFYGMSSKMAQNLHNGGINSYAAAEGKCIIVSKKGTVESVVNEILGGLRSACTYVGTENLKHFSKCCSFVRTR